MTTNSTINIVTTATNIDMILKQFTSILPVIFILVGFIGFLGNLLTYLQPTLRSNTCCIYLLCGSIVDVTTLFFNLLPTYLRATHGIIAPWLQLSYLCKFQITMLVFLPHLSINFLLMSIIDRYACTCSLTSSIRRINQLKMVPWFILLTILISFLASIRNILLYEPTSLGICLTTQLLTNNILYILLNGLMQPITMLIFVLLTILNVHRSRQRVGGVNATANVRRSRNQFIGMIFAQILATGFISLQWIIMYILNIILYDGRIKFVVNGDYFYFFYFLTNYLYYLNNVKPFYVSLLTSRLFRETFIQGLRKFVPHHYLQRWQKATVRIPTLTATIRMNQPGIEIR